MQGAGWQELLSRQFSCCRLTEPIRTQALSNRHTRSLTVHAALVRAGILGPIAPTEDGADSADSAAQWRWQPGTPLCITVVSLPPRVA